MLVDNAAALRALDAEGIGEAPVPAVDQIQRRETLSLWPAIFFEALPIRPH